MRELILINPPALIERPPVQQSGTYYIPDNLVISAINPGLLSIATYLDEYGFDIEIIDLSHLRDFNSIEQNIKKLKANIFGISSTSGFDYVECLEIAKFIKKYNNCPVIIGGQHAGPLGRLVLKDSDNIDAVVKFEGEWVTKSILERNRKNEQDIFELPGIVYKKKNEIIEIPGRPPIIDINLIPPLKYGIYPNAKKFTPYVEESRGCSYKCLYCTSNTVNGSKINLKTPKRFLNDMESCIQFFGKDKSYAVLASTFGFNPQWGKEIAIGMKQYNIKWNSEFRADSPWETYIDNLLDSGYEVVNVGVESGSPDILKLMGKTTNPKKYLSKMKMLADIVYPSEAIIRANFIFYVGETPKSLKETLRFIMDTPKIDAVQFSPLFAFYGTPLFQNFREYQHSYGSELEQSKYWSKRRVYPVHPSTYFSFNEVALLGQTFEKIFSNERAWYEAAKSLYSQETLKERNAIKKTLIESRFKRS